MGKEDGWKQLTFADVITSILGGTSFKTAEYSDSGTPVLTKGDVKPNGVIIHGGKFVDTAHAEEMGYKVTSPGDFIITTRDLTTAANFLGLVAQVPSSPRYLVNQGSSIFRIDTNLLDARYFIHWCCSDEYRGYVKGHYSGATQIHLRQTDLFHAPVQVPPLPTQRKIAGVLSAYDDLIENNTRRIAILEEVAQAVYREWFVNFRFPGHEKVKLINSPLGKIPEGWKRPFPDYVDFLEGPGLRRWQYREEGIPFLNIRTIGNNDIDLSKCQFVDPAEVEQKYSHFLLRPLDHIVSSSGTIGRIATVQQHHLPLMLNTSIIRMAPKNEAVGRWQLKHFLQSPYFQDQIVAHASGVAQMNYGPSHLKLMWIIAPDEATGIAYEQHVEPMESLLCSLVKKNTNLRTTRDLLLPKLISGQLDVEELDIDTGESAVADASGSDLVCSDAVSEGAERSEPQASTPTRKKQS